MAATLTIRNLDGAVKTRLRLQAAARGHSMEQEARDILSRALQPVPEAGLAERIRARFAGLGGEALPMPPRRAARMPEGLAPIAQAAPGAVHQPAPPPYAASPGAAPAPTPASRPRRGSGSRP